MEKDMQTDIISSEELEEDFLWDDDYYDEPEEEEDEDDDIWNDNGFRDESDYIRYKFF
jgi:hypothetical protein